MNELFVRMALALLGIVIGAGTGIFAAGKRSASAEKDVAQSKLDINRVGSKGRDDEKAALRRHLNLCLMIVAAENDPDKRFRIAGQLKED